MLEKQRKQIYVYYARAMDEIPDSEILSDDENMINKLYQQNCVLINPFQQYDNKSYNYEKTIKRNCELLEQSDILIANLSLQNYTYVGAIFEIVQAVNLKMPTIIFTGESILSERIYIKYYCDYVCKTIDEAISYIGVILTHL